MRCYQECQDLRDDMQYAYNKTSRTTLLLYRERVLRDNIHTERTNSYQGYIVC